MPVRNTNILISGADIAGPALAFWLNRCGFTTTVIEKSPKPRTGGNVFGLDGKRGIEALEQLGLWPRVQQERFEGYQCTFVGEEDKLIGTFNAGELTAEITGSPIA
ncbi:hypothetical protein [Rhizobiales bacterium 3FA27D7]|jgi:2-polyprenyl-6-methoxyphenol hydroxylase-like FAD-dependent oxidoreductase|uniref:hypothetical protein n=1 Tax=Mesorhizobium sp. 2RAF21 TaxID=3232995 RepID=UPI0010F71F15